MIAGLSYAPLLAAFENRITFVSASGNGVPAGTALTLSVPAGVANGDLMLAYIFGANVTSSDTMTGWTYIGGVSTGSLRCSVYRRIASSEPSSYTYSLTTGTRGGVILAYRGGAASVDLLGAVDQTAGATSTAPGIAATKSGVLLAVFGKSALTTVSAPPAGMTERSALAGSGVRVAAYDLTPSPAGATGDKSATWASASGNNACLLTQIY